MSYTRTFIQADTLGAAQVEINYNLTSNLALGTISCQNCVSLGNVSSNPSINSTTGQSFSAFAINNGHPGKLYTDTDLTRNDRGVAGGSFNYENFWPIQTGGSRVFLVKAPRVANQTTTIRAEAEGYDR